MNLDELQTRWNEYDRKLDSLVQLNRKLLNTGTLGRARSALRRQRRSSILATITSALVIPLVGLFIGLNHDSPKYLVPAIAIDLYFIAILIVHARQVHLLSDVDYTGPVAAIQRRIDTLVRLRIRFAQWLTMTMVLMWVPISIVAAKAFLDVDLYTLAPGWLLINTAVGLGLIALMLPFARRVARGQMTAPLQGLLRAAAGENLGAAKTFLGALSDLEQEGSPR